MRKPLLFIVVALALTSCAQGKGDSLSYVAADSPAAAIYTYNQKTDALAPADSLFRGTQVTLPPKGAIKVADVKYASIVYNRKSYYIPIQNLSTSADDVVLEKYVYAKGPVSLISDTLTSRVGTLVPKAAAMQVLGYSAIDTKGNVKRYKVRYGSVEGYIYGQYAAFDKESASKIYREDIYKEVHSTVRNPFGGGKASSCDFQPHVKPQFKDNKMPDACYALYLNFSPKCIGNIDKYIALAKKTKINTFVLDIKDDTCPGYKAEAMRIYSPTNYNKAGSDKEQMYAYAVRRLHEEGFYVVGRITCFKDSYYVKDHPESAITELTTGQPFKHNKSYWPSAYDRGIWQFNVELAKESVRKFGFNEINFDYVRFPDRMTRIEDQIDYHNRYNETKVQAIQRFVTYACDELHALGVYVSIDVFGESASTGYTTAYGQYWPAISSVADVMCGMPYPDHFANGTYGIQNPWNKPYELLYAWGKKVQYQQSVTPSPAKVRTWVQTWKVMSHVDRNGIDYNAENVEKEIRGLYESGCTDGYLTWLASSNIERYATIQDAFKIDYNSEYKK